MDTALVATWKAPYPGREQQALDHGVDVQQYWSALAADGRCSQPELFFFSDGTGMWLVRGERAALDAAFWAPEGQQLNTKCMLLLSDYRWAFGVTGPGADEYLLGYATAAKDLAIL